MKFRSFLEAIHRPGEYSYQQVFAYVHRSCLRESKMLLFLVLPFLIAGYSSENGSCGFHLALAAEPVNPARSFLCTLVPPQTISVTNRCLGQTPATWWMVASTVCPWSQSPQGFLMLPNKKIIIKLVLNKEVEILLYS